ncbi:hypothetical protein N7530_008724 [Penicillium desertorum]|uniref:Uncharacterized protein n=1 Tax=Penicillium desertorum TaxID=1303715 RepID=A0A9X0BLJ7_9EURO|nr:hypothetical protein N7530_008724 [Penicillium desertorum]
MKKLSSLLRERSAASGMSGLVQDAYRFIFPLWSMIKQLFRRERPNNIAIAPAMGDDWDAHTGACLQTLSIASAVSGLSFDATGSSLHTNIGIVALRDSPTLAPTISTAVLPLKSQSLPATQYSQTPEYQGYRISSDGSWITRCSQNWLWLPPMYRPVCSAVGQSGLALVLGCQSGRVLIFGFAAGDYN